MNFTLFRIPFFAAVLLLLGIGGGMPEVGYEVDQFGPSVSMLSLHSRSDAVTTALSSDGTTFRIHKLDGVFIDNSPVELVPGGAIRGINQLRGAAGIDLVVSFNAPVVVEGRDTGQMVRFVFVAASEAVPAVESKAPAAGLDPVAERKIVELRQLVRELTLEVVDLKKKLSKCSK